MTTAVAGDRLAFIKAICAEPGVDVHRLVFADYLQENGEGERAEFIRVQCELSRGAPYPSCWRCKGTGQDICDRNGKLQIDECDHCDDWAKPNLIRRERELLAWEWCPVNHSHTTRRIRPETCSVELLDGDGFRVGFQFTRGFISAVTCSAQDWLKHANRIAWHPSQTVRCEACEDDSPDWVHCNSPVPRPCPETAQPIERVTLTTESGLAFTKADGWGWHHDRWPDIEFTLSPIAPS